MVVAHVKAWIQVFDVGFGGELDGVAKEAEVKVGVSVHIKLPRVFAYKCKFASDVEVDGGTLCFVDLSAYGDIVFGVDLVAYRVAYEAGHVIVAVFVGAEERDAEFGPFVKAFAHLYAECVAYGIAVCSVAHVVVVAVVEGFVVVLQVFVAIYGVFGVAYGERVDEAGDGDEFSRLFLAEDEVISQGVEDDALLCRVAFLPNKEERVSKSAAQEDGVGWHGRA